MTNDPHRESGPRPFEQMQRMISGHFLAQCLHAAAVLGIADLIERGQTSLDELAAATRQNRPSLLRLLRTLSSVGVLGEQPNNQFLLTPLGATLRTDAPDSVRDMAIFMSSEPIWRSWGSLLDCLKLGQPSFPQLYHSTMYQYLTQHAELGAAFNRFMTAQSELHNAAVVDAYDFSGIQILIDVGGGHGATLSAILSRYPQMKGIVFDLPEVITAAGSESQELAERCQFVGGDMLERVPAGGDAYLIKRVLMDRSDEEAIAVLGHCRAAVDPGGKILVIDPMLPASNEPHPNWFMDMHMLVVHGGACRTEMQFRSLLDLVGLQVLRVIRTRSPNFIIECKRH